jgi:hypothetical protein
MTRAKSIIKKTGDQVVDTGVIVKGVINVAPEDQLQAQFDMANIVLVSKGKMEKWRKDQDKLKQEMEDQSNKVESNLRSRKYSFEQKRSNMEKDMTEKLGYLNKEYSDLQLAEAEQKDNNTQQMKNMEIMHNKCKEELQDLFEKKLDYELKELRELKKRQVEVR